MIAARRDSLFHGMALERPISPVPRRGRSHAGLLAQDFGGTGPAAVPPMMLATDVWAEPFRCAADLWNEVGMSMPWEGIDAGRVKAIKALAGRSSWPGWP